MLSSETFPTRPLGRNGPLVPRLGLGLMGASGVYGIPDEDAPRLALLDKAYEMGERFWDTADIYGDSEDLLGKWFAANPEKRKDIFLATKFGEGTLKGKPNDSSPENCRECIDLSLKRLGLPFVDLFYIHRLDTVTPVEKTIQAMVELKNAGKIKYIGLSECSAATLRRAHAVHPVTCVQLEYSMFTKDIELPKYGLLETARELGIATVAYSPMARGLLAGSIRSRADFTKEGDRRGILPWLSEENLDSNLALVAKLEGIAKAKGCTVAQLSLAWLLAQGDDIFPIPGSSKVPRLEANISSLQVVLTAEEEKTIRAISDERKGERFPEHLLGHCYADSPPLA
ncbi:aldo-keto reductase [Thozetella sp. PMI_491]|nr:aldo-keto reductase [Thozetella sp. PMI_491]